MIYKYLAWESNGIFSGQKLLSVKQCECVITSLLRVPKAQSIFTTIQDYDKDGNIVKCPIYVDIDSEHIELAHQDAIKAMKWIECRLNITPLIYFSGGKGFHLVIKYDICHDKCHDIVRTIIEPCKIECVDYKVYTSHRLWRLPNSFNLKGQKFKVELTREELIYCDTDEMLDFAKKPQKLSEDKILLGIKDDLIQDAIHRYDEKTKKHTLKPNKSAMPTIDNITPCIKALLESSPINGERNATVVILARFFKSCGVPQTEALNIIMSKKHWSDYQFDEKGVAPVLNAIYKSNKESIVSCRGADGKIMKKYCDLMCQWNMDEVWKDILWK